MTLIATLNQSQLQNLCENYLETPLLIKGSIDRSNIEINIKPYVHEEKGQFRRMLQIKVKFKQEIWTAMATDVKNNGQRTDNCGERCLWKLEENEVYVCVFVRHGLRSTSFVLGDATKSGVSHFSFIHLT